MANPRTFIGWYTDADRLPAHEYLHFRRLARRRETLDRDEIFNAAFAYADAFARAESYERYERITNQIDGLVFDVIAERGMKAPGTNRLRPEIRQVMEKWIDMHHALTALHDERHAAEQGDARGRPVKPAPAHEVPGGLPGLGKKH